MLGFSDCQISAQLGLIAVALVVLALSFAAIAMTLNAFYDAARRRMTPTDAPSPEGKL